MEKRPYVSWIVKDEEYKLKLTTSGIVKLEEKLGGNLLNPLMETTNNKVPPLAFMLAVTHAGMQKYNHGIKLSEVYDIFDEYMEEGGTQTDFLTDVLVPLFEVSGFFSQAQAEKMKESK